MDINEQPSRTVRWTTFKKKVFQSPNIFFFSKTIDPGLQIISSIDPIEKSMP